MEGQRAREQTILGGVVVTGRRTLPGMTETADGGTAARLAAPMLRAVQLAWDSFRAGSLGIGAVVILQLLFTYLPPLQRLFYNEAIPLWVWPWLFVGGLVFFLVVEAEKLVIRSSGSLRRAVTAAEAGA